MAPIPPYLRDLQAQVQGYADEFGLDYFTQVFELVDYRQMCEIASYGGFPVRYPHWRFGMEFDHMLKSHTYGLSKVYELVINTDPWITHRTSFDDVVGEFETFTRPESGVLKAMIEVNG